MYFVTTEQNLEARVQNFTSLLNFFPSKLQNILPTKDKILRHSFEKLEQISKMITARKK